MTLRILASAVFVASIFIYSPTQAQDGLLPVHSLALRHDGQDARAYAMVQGPDHLMYLATNHGLMRYDGQNTAMLAQPGSIYSLAFDGQGTLWLAGRFGLATVSPSQLAQWEVNMVYHSEGEAIWKVLVTEEQVYAFQPAAIRVFDAATEQLVGKLEPKAGDLFQDMILSSQGLVATGQGNRHYLFSGGEMSLWSAGLKGTDQLVDVALQPGHAEVWLTADAKAIVVEKNNRTPLSLEKSDMLRRGLPSTLTRLGADTLAIGTLLRGVFLYSQGSGKLLDHIDLSHGLPHAGVASLLADEHRNLWALHDGDVFMLGTNSPFRAFHTYPGLRGVVDALVDLGDSLYVATDFGVFYGSKLVETTETVTTRTVQVNERVEPQAEPEEERRGFLGRLFGQQESGGDPVFRPRYLKVKERSTQDSVTGFAFRPVSNLTGDRAAIMQWGKWVIANSGHGIYRLENGKASSLQQTAAVAMWLWEEGDKLVTLDPETNLHLWARTETGLRKINTLTAVRSEVFDVGGPDGKTMYLATDHGVMAWNTASIAIEEVETFEVENPFSSAVYCGTEQGELRVFLNNKVLALRDSELKVVETHKEGYTFRKGLKGHLWLVDHGEWKGAVGLDISPELEAWLGALQDPRIAGYATLENRLWVVTRPGELLSMTPGQTDNPTPLPVRLLSVNGGETEQERLEFDYDINDRGLSVHIAQPDYNDLRPVMYQFLLKGLSEQWTDWQTSGNINYSYLPTGNYSLHVRSKNAFDQVQEAELVSFKVRPPYWQTLWFGSLEFVFFGILLVLSYRLNRGNRANKILSSLLTFLTLVLIVEFMQTIGETYLQTGESPVVDFFINVAIAFLILPIERVLHAFITKSKVNRTQKASEA